MEQQVCDGVRWPRGSFVHAVETAYGKIEIPQLGSTPDPPTTSYENILWSLPLENVDTEK